MKELTAAQVDRIIKRYTVRNIKLNQYEISALLNIIKTYTVLMEPEPKVSNTIQELIHKLQGDI